VKSCISTILPIAVTFAVEFDNDVLGQIIPDTTLRDNSIVKVEGNTSTIEGGTNTGTNLFHSFQEFSVRTNGTAYFNNATDIQNIITSTGRRKYAYHLELEFSLLQEDFCH
jgi:large exoprotein involved in heme utilization and adhesion